MSTPAQIVSDVRRFAHVNTTQYVDADAYLDLNKVKDDLWNRIVSRWFSSNYNWDIWTATTVALQSEYLLDLPTGTNAGQKTINNVYINYDGETYTNTGGLMYIKCREIDPKNLEMDWTWYEEFQSEFDPIFFQKDNSVFIAPVPLAADAWSNRLKLEGIRKIANYTSGTTEAEVKIPVEYHYVLELGLMPYALISKWTVDTNEVNNARVVYNNAANDVVRQMTSRMEAPTEFKYPWQEDEESVVHLIIP